MTISITNLTVQYVNDEELLPPALSKVDLEIAAGEVVLLTGPSGCGKSTLLRCLNGLVPHFYETAIAGTVNVAGITVVDSDITELAQHVGMVFQDPRSEFFTFDVTSELAFCCENFQVPGEEISQRITDVTAAVGIEDLLDRGIIRLSSGEKQKVALAAAMTTHPTILLFDEPSANLDTESLTMLRDVIAKLKARGITVIVADHRMSYLVGLLDRCVILDGGKIIADLTAKQLRAQESQWFTQRGLRQPIVPTLETSDTTTDFEPHLVIRNAEFSYPGTDVLWRIKSLALPRSGIIGMAGPNGCGKTTFIKYVLGLLGCRGSTFTVAGRKLSRRDRRHRFAYVAQDVDYQLMGESVLAEMMIGQPDNDATRAKAEKLLDTVGLGEFRHRHPLTLSGGQKQRLSIAMACMKGADVMCLDEPTSGLDAKNMDVVSDLLRRLAADGMLILVITHDQEFAAKTFDHTLAITDHKIRLHARTPQPVGLTKNTIT